MPDLPLADLDAFATIARLKNFRAAGKLRGVSASSLSEAMRRLEARVGVRLLNRTTRSVTLTDAGARLLERLSPTLSEIELALDDINQFRDRPFGRLRLNVPGIVARCVLPEIVNGFLQAYPDIVVEVSVNDALIDVLAEGFDAGIRYEESLHRDMIAVPIGPRRQRYVCVAAPDYLARHGVPKDPGALVDHYSVLHRFAAGLINEWRFERGGQTINSTPPPRLIAETVDLELSAVRAGLGLMRTFEDFVAEYVATGRLVRVLTDWEDEFSGPFLYYHSRRQMPVPLRVFIDHVRQLGAR